MILLAIIPNNIGDKIKSIFSQRKDYFAFMIIFTYFMVFKTFLKSCFISLYSIGVNIFYFDFFFNVLSGNKVGGRYIEENRWRKRLFQKDRCVFVEGCDKSLTAAENMNGISFLGLILTRVLNMSIPFTLAISLLGIDPREIIWKVRKNTWITAFIQGLFIMEKKTTLKLT